MPKLVLKSNVNEGMLDLDSLLMKDHPIYQTLPPEARGVQALAGLTGLGLPSLSTQWMEGAGDGASFRGQRVLPRDIDLPLYLQADDRNGLKVLLSRVARILGGECELRIVEDDGEYWYVNVRRVGGGNYVYGTDTIGENDFMTVVTLRAGDPFWVSSKLNSPIIKTASSGRGLLQGVASLTSLKLKSAQTLGAVILENLGDAAAWPRWEITGPGSDFMATSPSGEVLHWAGTLADGRVLYIDTKTGRVWDDLGANRFADMAPAPRMWKVPPGVSTATVALSGASAGGGLINTPGSDRYNHVTNPAFGTGISGYTATTATNPVVISWDAASESLKAVAPTSGSPWIYHTVTGLTIGNTYTVKAQAYVAASSSDSGSAWVKVGGTNNYSGTGNTHNSWVQLTTTFTATATSQLIELHAATSPTAPTTNYFDNVYVGLDTQYFDGNTTDTLTNVYEWTGTPHASTSRKWDVTVGSESKIACVWQDRKQMVI